ncbi:DUF2520 domain-containing protein [Flavobacterium sp. CYK-55]|uniref:Rossmann-like and DUF2520 domain-containing protein n=1 Tax=Flavobacterium sp. CYK-55 TaxID=2835529 RepID=UPI001BCFC732|nr:Rossmann-like and DUF2520 domain-containing protein [Flavobacterium sp. CYK-55]MBS7786689.1 DUF2520 domain-containing protein [Flavobacterium sp. CYK-55]
MIKIGIVGSGNVAHHLIQVFQKAEGMDLVQVVARNPNALEGVIDASKIINSPSDLLPLDLCIIAVSDNAINTVSQEIKIINCVVAHTSGSMPLDVLSQNQRGVFYPLQTFSKNKAVDFKNIPIAIEALNSDDQKLLETVAKSISEHVYNINSEQRKALHVAAVFACNFVNHMYSLGEEICREHQMSFDLLRPLIAETASKIEVLLPKDAQTGPAIRHDQKTIETHLAMLSDENQKNIYALLTQSIQNHE